MNRDEFLKKRRELEGIIENAKKEISDLNYDYIQEHKKYSPMQKVLAPADWWLDRGNLVPAFIQDVVGIDDKGEIEYRLRKAKKDGTISQVAFRYGWAIPESQIQPYKEEA